VHPPLYCNWRGGNSAWARLFRKFSRNRHLRASAPATKAIARELSVDFSRCFAIGCGAWAQPLEKTMHGIIYLVGLIVVIMAILSFFGLR
jgi:hypothetical protein